jgi:hypothetical protein
MVGYTGSATLRILAEPISPLSGISLLTNGLATEEALLCPVSSLTPPSAL